jgi:hypothetical protein
LAEPQYLQVPPHQPQAQQRRKKVKSEEASPTLVPTSPQLQSPQSQPQPQPLKQQPAAQWPERSGSAVEVKMEVVSAEEGEEEEEEEGAHGDETTKHSSIRSRRARKAAAAAAARNCGDGDGAGGRVESMLERLMALYEQDRAGRCGGEAEVREQQLRHQQLQLKEQELRLREERVEMRERELEQRERDQLARLHLREEAMLLRERELELVIRERTLALALSSAASPTPQQ